jgi:iron complex outermembrane receptor protein
VAAWSACACCWGQATGTDPGEGPMPRIVVQAQRQSPESSRVSVNQLTTAPLSETPISASVIDADQLLDRGVKSLSSAIRDEPSAANNYNTFGYVERIKVRGFDLDEKLNFRRDGLPITSHVPIGLENKQAIEILKGVSGVLGGDAAPGGVLNFVLKRPTDTVLRQLNAEYSERGSRLVTGDFGGRLDDGRFGYRINLAAENRHPAADNAWSRRAFGSGFFDWRVAPGTLVELEFEHQGVQEISVPGFGLLDTTGSGVATTLPPPIDPRINLNAQPWTQPFQSRETTGSVRLTQQLAADWEVGVRLGEQRSVINDRIAFPDGCSQWLVQVPAGSYVYPGLCQINGHDYMDINQYISDDERRNMQVLDAYLHGNLTIGAVDQELRIGWRSTRYEERYPPYQTYNFVGTIDIFAPVALPPNTQALTANTDMDLHMDELSVFDVLRFAHGWSTWLALRATRLSQATHLDAPDGSGSFESVSLSQDFVTPFASLGYTPWAGGFAYLSGGEGVEIEQVPNKPMLFVNAGQVLPALRSRQVELGFKQTAAHGQAFSAALFQIEKPFSDDLATASGPSLRIAGARLARHRGLELSGSWLVSTTWRLEARATWLDAVTTESLHPTWVGHATTNVPHLASVLRAAWQPPRLRGLTVSNQLTYGGHKAVLPDGSVDIASAWQWDLALQYRVVAASSTWTWRAGIDNLTDRAYWRDAPTQTWGAQYLFPAPPRTARAGVEVRF